MKTLNEAPRLDPTVARKAAIAENYSRATTEAKLELWGELWHLESEHELQAMAAALKPDPVEEIARIVGGGLS